ncbi:hypothetical protein ACFL31_01125 [Candidatus Margulisiibacteriota bacterium]
MKAMDNAQIMKAMEKFALHGYLKTLIDSELDKITLFTIFPQTGSPNLSNPVHVAMIKDLKKITALNSGEINN